MSKRIRALSMAGLACLLLGVPAASRGECPEPMGHTIASLRECVLHAAEDGHIDGATVLQSLLAKIDAAQVAYDRGQIATAVYLLRAFIQEVEALAGKQIDAEHAAHMIEHAGHVIEAISS